MTKIVRSEAAVFDDLAALARQPGYVHAIAQICYRDNFIAYRKEMKPADLQKLFSQNRLIRTEITTILGLLIRDAIDFSVPTEHAIKTYVDRTDDLLKELHDAIGAPGWHAVIAAAKKGEQADDIWRGDALREPIFYGGESAYSFQYRDFAPKKYQADDAWLIQNKGFSINQAHAIAGAMCSLFDEKMTYFFNESKRTKQMPRTWLPAFEQSAKDIVARSGIPEDQILAFLNAFTLRGDKHEFQSVSDFNPFNATPLLQASGDRVLLFLHYSLYESLYESPFYWMGSDKAYLPTLAQHRGAFTEEFTEQRMIQVFGSGRVHKNVMLDQVKGKPPGEIDVLVIFGDRLIIIQAKSKKLTLEARRGNDGQLRKDFAAAIQDSYDQAWLCAKLISENGCKLLDPHGNEIALPHAPKEIFIFNVIAEHYPALAFQTRQFLKYQISDVIRPPFVMDVFLLDALTEMLDTPLHLLSYAKLRVDNIERITMSHELTALAFHLKTNLLVDSKFDMVMLEDDIATDLDLAMTVRRDNVQGRSTPEGIKTRLAGTLYEHLVKQIESSSDPAILELGFCLLTLGENTCRNVHLGLKAITKLTRSDGKVHDFTIGGEYGGITFHCNPAPSALAMRKLESYCHCRKYEQKANRWFGISVDANCLPQFGISLRFKWEKDDAMELATTDMKKAVPVESLTELMRHYHSNKVGRNDPCPCGSGIKHKKCCLQK
jgi:hypothetical protein